MLEVQAVACPQIECYIWYKDNCIVEKTLKPWLKVSTVISLHCFYAYFKITLNMTVTQNMLT